MIQQANVTNQENFFRGLSGNSLERFIHYAESPARQSLYQKAYKQARENGLKGKAAHMRAKYASSAFNAMQPVGNAGVLTEDAWQLLTDEVVQVARRRLNGVRDLISRGLTSDAGDLGTFVVNWQSVTDLAPAQVSIDGRTRAPYDQGEYTLQGAAMPIIHKDLDFDMRSILASRRAGVPLDTSNGQRAAILVADKEEDILFNGSTVQYGNTGIFGYTTHTSRTTETTSLDFGTIGNIDTKFRNCIEALQNANHFGPYVAYVALTQYHQMLARHTDGSGQRALDATLQLPGLEAIRPSQFLTDELVLVEMSPAVVDLAVAEDIRTVQWDAPGGMSTSVRIFSAKTPRLLDATGICHGTNI